MYDDLILMLNLIPLNYDETPESILRVKNTNTALIQEVAISLLVLVPARNQAPTKTGGNHGLFIPLKLKIS